MGEPGTRVWAVQRADDTTVYAYGWGIYLGDEPYPYDPPVDDFARVVRAESAILRSDAQPLLTPLDYLLCERRIRRGEPRGEINALLSRIKAFRRRDRCRPMAERVEELLHSMSLNPRIALERGGEVWGCECWWGKVAGEAALGRWLGGRHLMYVPAPHMPVPADGGGSS